jgi:hypothetical protein
MAYAIPKEYVPRTDYKSAKEIADALGLDEPTMYFTLPTSNGAVTNIEKMVAATEAPVDV